MTKLPDDPQRPMVLIVDDMPDNLTLLNDLLRDHYRVKVATHGDKALRIAASETPPDLILLDIMMPEMDGYEVCRRLKAEPRTRDIPVIFLTAMSAAEDEKLGLELGATDYISKPICGPVVMARVKNHLALKASADFLRDKNGYLELEVARRTQEVVAVQDVTIRVMAALAETRDTDTGNHIRRTQFYVKALAERLRGHPRFAAALTDHFVAMLFKSAPLHDVGKVGVPDRVLLKPGRFTPEEFEIMKSHSALGRNVVQAAEDSLGMTAEFLTLAKEIAYGHHERWDGKGYPQGLAGEAIPLSARLMAVADVYDALASRRVYKEGMPHGKAAEIIAAGRGTQFDPDIVDAFVALLDEFCAIAARFADAEQDTASISGQSHNSAPLQA